MPTLARLAYTLSQALSQAASTADSFQKTGNPQYVLGAVSGIAAGVIAYNFQGRVIDGPMQVQSDHVVINMDNPEETPLLGHLGPASCFAKFMQANITTTSFFFNACNRYFLFSNLCLFFGIAANPALIATAVSADLLFTAVFNLSNELYETNAELRNFIDKTVEAKPMYANWRCFQAIANSKLARGFFIIFGCLEHAIVDDILPWLLFIPDNVAAYLASCFYAFATSSAIKITLAFLLPLVGAALAVLLVFQTLAFEGEHSFKNFADSLGPAASFSLLSLQNLPRWILKSLYAGTYLMPVVHGAASAAPVFVYLQKLFDLHKKHEKHAYFSKYTAWEDAVTLVLSVITFIGTTWGHWRSEAKEAWAELEEVLVMR